MRLYHKLSVVLSEDNSSNPKEVQFSTVDQEDVDTTIDEGGGRTVKLAAATNDHEIPMGAITAGAWFYLKGDQDFTLKIDNGAARVIKANKPNLMWMTFASLKISTIDETRLTYVIAGQ